MPFIRRKHDQEIMEAILAEALKGEEPLEKVRIKYGVPRSTLRTWRRLGGIPPMKRGRKPVCRPDLAENVIRDINEGRMDITRACKAHGITREQFRGALGRMGKRPRIIIEDTPPGSPPTGDNG